MMFCRRWVKLLCVPVVAAGACPVPRGGLAAVPSPGVLYPERLALPGVREALPVLDPIDVPPPPVLSVLRAFAISAAMAYLIGMTSWMNSGGTETSTRLTISSILLTFSP